jgi:hypothetical protein
MLFLNFFSDKTKHNKIYDFYKTLLNKMNDQTYLKKKVNSDTIKIRSEYKITKLETSTHHSSLHHYLSTSR